MVKHTGFDYRLIDPKGSQAPRGLSVEEKRVKLLEIFHETKDFFQLKELEKLGQKKGVVLQTVKEILQSLVDDGLVTMDKVGTSNFFWNFPSARQSTLKNQITLAEEERSQARKRRDELTASIANENKLRIETPERVEALAKFAALRETLLSLENEKAQYGACDPELFEKKMRAVRLSKEATFRWTDNVQIVLSHFGRLHNLMPEDLRKHFDLGDDFEDVD